MIAPPGKSLRRSAHDDTVAIPVFLVQVLLPPEMSVYKVRNNCVRFKNRRDALWCTLQKVEMERTQRSASAIEKHGELTEQEVALTARVRRILQ
jgi:hypothetical protein